MSAYRSRLSNRLLSLTSCMENQETPGRIKLERFILVEISRKKVIPFEVLSFSRFYRNDRNFRSVPFVWITSVRLHVERKSKIYRYFVNGATQSLSCFRCQINTSTILTDIFHRN